jgi:hypothetical protein
MPSYAILYEVVTFKIGIFSLWPLNLKTGINQFNNAAMMITVGRVFLLSIVLSVPLIFMASVKHMTLC